MSDMDTDADNTKYLSFVFSSHKRKRRIKMKPSQPAFEIYLENTITANSPRI